MKQLKEQLKDVRVLTTCAMMLALATVLGFFKVPITQILELRFSFLPLACTGMLFGPALGGIIGALSDIFGYLARPTGPFFPGFTVSAIISGIIYGSILHNKEITIRRLVVAHLVHSVVITFGLNPLWLSMLYGKALLAVMSARVFKTVVMFPVEVALLWFILSPAKRISANVFSVSQRKAS